MKIKLYQMKITNVITCKKIKDELYLLDIDTLIFS